MLALTRKTSEQIWVSGPALITVVKRSGDRVTLGFTADASTRVVRTELLDHDERKRLGLPTDERQDA